MQETRTGYRLSPQQRQLWAVCRQNPTLRAQMIVRILGADERRLHRAVMTAAGRHEALRTTFESAPGIRLPVQSVAAECSLDWRVLATDGDAADDELLHAVAAAELERLADTGAGPVIQAVAVREKPAGMGLILTLPVLCADAISLGVLLAEIVAAYAGAGGESPVQYLQFAEWQNYLLEAEGDEAERYWRRCAAFAHWRPVLPLAEARPETAFLPRRHRLVLDRGRTAALAALAGELEVSVARVLLAAWQTLLARHLGGSELALGHVFPGREHPELQNLIGPLAKVAPVRVEIAAELPFVEVVRRADQAVCDAAAWLPAFVADGELPSSAAPAVSSLGFMEMPPLAVSRAGDVSFSVLEQRAYLDRWDLCLVCHEGSGELTADLHYDANRMRSEAVRAMAGQLSRLVETAVEDPRRTVGSFVLTGVEERSRLLVDLNRTQREYPQDRGAHQLFEEQVVRSPQAVAVAAPSCRLTYRELDTAANRLAHSLRARGVGCEDRVAIAAERSAEQVIAFLAVLKSGAACLPVDPALPRERVRGLLADAGVRVLLTQRRFAKALPSGECEVVLLGGPEDVGDAATSPGEDLAPVAGPENLAYVLYTSGSTGQPKGVMVSHRGLVNYLSWAIREYRLEEGAGAPLHTPAGFDLTLTSLLAPLLAGRCLFVVPEDQGLESAVQELADGESFSLLKLTPAHLDLLAHDERAAEAVRRSRVLVLGGEQLHGEALVPWRRHAPGLRLVNEYGPTETVVGCASYEIPGYVDPAPGAVPIGGPIANARLYLLDGDLEPVPAGVTGELYVGGEGLARGYLGAPARTSERFLPDPHAVQPGARMYRTGDLARRRCDGQTVFLGRSDRQLKIRGFRVEPGEVEAALLRHPAIREVAVVGHGERNETRLVAYPVAAEGLALPPVEELRQFLAGVLPDFMLPALYQPLPSLPLTANGKLDRAALPAPGAQRLHLAVEYVAPRDEVEEKLARIWVQALGIERVGVRENFFVLGGDSMRSVRVVALARIEGLSFTVQDLFRLPTIEQLAASLADTAAEEEQEDLARLLDEIERLSEEDAGRRIEGQAGIQGGER